MQKKLSQLLKKLFGPTSSKEFDHNDNLEIFSFLGSFVTVTLISNVTTWTETLGAWPAFFQIWALVSLANRIHLYLSASCFRPVATCDGAIAPITIFSYFAVNWKWSLSLFEIHHEGYFTWAGVFRARFSLIQRKAILPRRKRRRS